ncbi:MAG: hypothetical protein ACJ8F7_18500, partial [Gemmataceae bacterium]
MFLRVDIADAAVPRLPLVLRLRPDARPEPAELWLLRDDAEDHLAALVAECDDRLLERLQFAAVSHGGHTMILLLGRNERGLPPVFVGAAKAFAAVQKFPNLFAPQGQTVKPPLRRDVMRAQFADDPQVITWLEPAADGSVCAHRLPRSSFRPLRAVVEHFVEVRSRLVRPVRPIPPFAFSVFQTRDAPKPLPNSLARDFNESETATVTPFASRPPDIVVVRGMVPAAPVAPPVAPALEIPDLPALPDAELRQRLAERQRDFLALSGPPDSPERLALWPELAELHTAVGQPADAATCWLNALWESEAPP